MYQITSIVPVVSLSSAPWVKDSLTFVSDLEPAPQSRCRHTASVGLFHMQSVYLSLNEDAFLWVMELIH